MFNEGDRQNINIYLFGQDKGLFKAQVGQDWKTAMYGLFNAGTEFDFEYKVNDGDVVNINSILGINSAANVKRQNWKDAFYLFIAENLPAPADFVPVSQQLYEKK